MYFYDVGVYHVCFIGTIFVLELNMVSMSNSWRRLIVSSGQFFDEKFRGLGCGIEPIC